LSVVNDANETVGTVDDLIITPTGQAPYVILSVGGFLGMGTKYVALPFTTLKIVDKKVTLPGGTKDALQGLPDFKYKRTAETVPAATLSDQSELGGGHPLQDSS
jgi:PRC-barrel domain